MGILDGVSAGLTAATKAATGNAQGQREGSQLLRAIQMQQYQIAKEQAETNLATEHARVFRNTANAPQPGTTEYYDNLRNSAQATGEGANVPRLDFEHRMNPILAERTEGNALAANSPTVQAGKLDFYRKETPLVAERSAATVNAETPGLVRRAGQTVDAQTPGLVSRARQTEEATLPGKIALERAKLDNQPLRQDEAYTAMHLPRIAQSIGVIQQATAPGAWQKIASRGVLGNYTLTPQGQQYNAAVHRAALSLAVTLEGPRGATPQRVDMVEKTYFPQPGDDDSTAADKIQQLKEAVRSAVTKSGRGYQRMNPQDRAQIERFTGEIPVTDGAAEHPIVSKYGITPSVP